MNILITGGASGLGEAITHRLVANPDDTVWFTYHSSSEAAARIANSFPNARAINCNFRDQAQTERLLQQMETMDLDALVNNAIPVRIAKNHFHKLDLATFQDGFSSSILPVIAIAQRAIGVFRRKRRGRIVTILSSSLIGRPPAGYSEYASAKAYIHMLAKSWAAENATFGITSNCISPGFMSTRLTNDTDERLVETMITSHPLKRLLTPAEVAEAVAFFLRCSPHVNGNNLIMNAAVEMS